MNLTNVETVVESKFKNGKYFGYSHKQVLDVDPDYIISAYETKNDSAGISRECYRLAQLALDEEHKYEETGEVLVDFSDLASDLSMEETNNE